MTNYKLRTRDGNNCIKGVDECLLYQTDVSINRTNYRPPTQLRAIEEKTRCSVTVNVSQKWELKVFIFVLLDGSMWIVLL